MATKQPRPFGDITPQELAHFQEGFSPTSQADCWIWRKAKNSTGYGEVFVGGRVMLAHRMAWVVHNNREIPAGAFLLHSCDTPACVNPHHLRPGNQRQNHYDARERGRWSPPPIFIGTDHPACKLTPDQVREVRLAVGTGPEIAARFGITPGHVRSIKARRTWKHLP